MWMAASAVARSVTTGNWIGLGWSASKPIFRAPGSADVPWFATFRGRVGILADPSLLLYATGGLAVGEVRFASQPTAVVQLFDGGSNVPIGPPVTVVGVALSERQTHVGWTAGAGLE